MRRPRHAGLRPRLFAAVLLAMAVGRCASAPPAPPRDTFPLDPREGLAGPFDEAIDRGWRALLAGDAAAADKEFARPRSGTSKRASEIGTIEALVVGARSGEALSACSRALGEGGATEPLLVACGEARARSGDPVGGYELYEIAVSRAPGRSGMTARASQILEAATGKLMTEADRAAAEGRFEQARTAVAQALAWNPRSAPVLLRAAGVECAAGEKERALQYVREALAIGGLDDADRGRAGDLALEAGDYALAVSIFEAPAGEDPRFAERASEARLAFRITNWPEAERQAARARRVTRAGAAAIVWWMFPEVREAQLTGGVVASDVLERRDSRPVMRAVSLGLLDVDPDTHRARPDAPLTRAAGAQLMLRLAGVFGRRGGAPACLQGSPGPWRGAADAIRLAARCGLLSESGGPFVSGPELTRGLDRLRSLLPTAGGQEP